MQVRIIALFFSFVYERLGVNSVETAFDLFEPMFFLVNDDSNERPFFCSKYLYWADKR